MIHACGALTIPWQQGVPWEHLASSTTQLLQILTRSESQYRLFNIGFIQRVITHPD